VTPGRGASACGLALVLLLASAARAEIRQVEAVGAVPLAPDARHTTPLRDIAVRMALSEAVRRVALDLIPGVDPAEAAELLPGVLGDDPIDYTTRYRIIEDRGERPALFAEDPDVEFDYVVVVEAYIDADRVEKRLEAAGLLGAGRDTAPHRDIRLVVEDLEGFAAYASLRKALIEGVGVRSALPVEMERGRAVLVVNTAYDPWQLLDELLRAAPPELRITPLDTQEDAITLRIALAALPAGAETGAPAARAGGAAPRN
jgi:hypothetical protein